jgi:uncharacterized membrane protein
MKRISMVAKKLLPRFLRSRPRLFGGLLAGLVSWPLIPGYVRPVVREIMAWDFAVVVYLSLSILLFVREPYDRIARDAFEQEEGEWTIFWTTMGIVVASFAALLDLFSNVKNLDTAERALHVALVAVTLLVSWLMAHTTFAFRYAHEYYSTSPGGTQIDGGLQFPGEDNPDYLDFFYFALVLGMTFQVSDVQITSRKLRRLATIHGLMSFLFNTVIVALTVNIAASLM